MLSDSGKNIFDQVWTSEQLTELKKIIDILRGSMYTIGKHDWQKIVDRYVGTELVKYFRIEPSNRKSFLQNLEKKISKFQVMRMKLAFDPSPQIIAEIGQWIRQNIFADIVLEIDLDSSLIAGAEIFWQGKYLDLSLGSKFDLLLKEIHEV